MKIGFIGAGNMGRAIANGLRKNGICDGSDLFCYSATGKGAAAMAAQTGASICQDKTELIKRVDLVVLAFKPQHLETISAEEASTAEGKLVVSILAGRTLDSLKSVFPLASNLVRVMPNTPSQIGKGVSTFCFHQKATPEQATSVETLLNTLGTAYQVEESQLHIATVVNGCGPAFYFQIAKLISESAERRGLQKDLALKLASETAIGSFELLLDSGREPQDLIDEVVSPNGVTFALLQSLDKGGLAGLIDQSCQDAVQRSVELSQPN